MATADRSGTHFSILSVPTGRTAMRWTVTSDRLATGVLWFGSVALCIMLISYISYRAVQSYPLDAFEEYELHKVIRWTEGVSLYSSPDTEVLPEAYPPLYFCLLRFMVGCVGESFAALRLLSLIALLGMVAAGCCALRDSRDRHVARLVFVAVLLSFHALTGKWFEIGKPDTLLALFLALAIVAGKHDSWGEVLTSSVALWCASLTKQNAPLFLVPLCFAHLLAGRRRWAIGWWAAMSSLIGASYFVLNWWSGGQFSYWVFSWTAGHGVHVRGGMVRTVNALLTRGPLLIAILGGSIALRPRCHWTWCLVAALGLAVMGMSKEGGLENHLLPAVFVGAVVAGRWAGEVWSREMEQCGGWLWRWAVVAALVVAAWPGSPHARDFRWIHRRAEETDDWVQAVRRLDGRVAVSHHLLLARRAGAQCFFSDLILQFPGLVVPSAVRAQIKSQAFDYLVLAADPRKSPTPEWASLISEYYESAGELDFSNRSGVLPRRVYKARRLLPYNEP